MARMMEGYDHDPADLINAPVDAEVPAEAIAWQAAQDRARAELHSELAGNKAFLALSSPSQAQIVAQVQALTRQQVITLESTITAHEARGVVSG